MGLDRTFTLAKKYRIKVAFGTDILFSAEQAQDQWALLVMTTRWYSPAEALAMATGLGAQLLAPSGERNAYPGKLGVVEEGALADLLLVDGNPIENIKLVADPAKSFVVIMKDRKGLQEHAAEGTVGLPPQESSCTGPSTAALCARDRSTAPDRPPGNVDATQHRPAAACAPFTNVPRALMLAVTNLPCRPGKDTALGAPR